MTDWQAKYEQAQKFLGELNRQNREHRLCIADLTAQLAAARELLAALNVTDSSYPVRTETLLVNDGPDPLEYITHGS